MDSSSVGMGTTLAARSSAAARGTGAPPRRREAGRRTVAGGRGDQISAVVARARLMTALDSTRAEESDFLTGKVDWGKYHRQKPNPNAKWNFARVRLSVSVSSRGPPALRSARPRQLERRRVAESAIGWPPPPLAPARHRNPRSLDRGEPRPRAPPAPVPVSLADRALARPDRRSRKSAAPHRAAPERRHRGGDRASRRSGGTRSGERSPGPAGSHPGRQTPPVSLRTSEPTLPALVRLGPSETIAIDPPTDDLLIPSSLRQVPA